MHTFADKLAHIRPLRAVDFEEEDSHFDAQPIQDASPPKLLVRIHYCTSQVVTIFNFHSIEWKLGGLVFR